MSRVADILLARGENAARGRAASGQAWGRAVSNIAQVPGQVMGQRQQQADRTRQQQIEAEQMQLARNRDTRETQSAQGEAEMRAAKLDDMRRNLAGEEAEKLLTANDPAAVAPWIQSRIGKLWDEAEGAALLQKAATPEGAQSILQFMAPRREAKPAEPFTLKDERGGETRFSGKGEPIASAPPAGPAMPTPANDETARHNRELERIAGLTAGRTEAAQKETERHNRAMEALAAAAAGDVTDLTPEGLDAAALNYAKTGVLPPLGNGDKVTRKKIINRAAQMIPDLDIASAKADFGANQDALKALVKQREALGAFEATAIKNLDVFLAAAAKVPDTGSPLLNRPLRALNENVLGGAELTAFNTARRTVIPEFAKILANPGLSGQLSDSARKEIEDVVSGNATLKQTMAAAKILKQDTENRRTSYDDQIAGIRGRIGKATGAATTPKADPLGIRK